MLAAALLSTKAPEDLRAGILKKKQIQNLFLMFFYFKKVNASISVDDVEPLLSDVARAALHTSRQAQANRACARSRALRSLLVKNREVFLIF